jgi:uridine phosphorylase
MAYPNFKDKHLQDALFNPSDYLEYGNWDKKKFPSKYILTYQGYAKSYFLRKYKPKKFRVNGLLTIFIHNGIGFVKLGIGSPAATAVMEELIAAGGKEFISIGTAGGLHKEGVFLCKEALRDEGTSYHYIKSGRYSYPHKTLTKKFGNSICKEGLEYHFGTTWTIDAPYRETKAEIEKYAKKGISTVEMEASALFTLAKYRGVKIASAFSVSDLLIKKWEPNFHKFNVRRTQNRLIDAAVKCLS